MATVAWVRCIGGVWCPLENLNLSAVSGSGVYVIWAGSRWVYVGQGEVAARLQAHRNEPAILAYRSNGQLMVTWALVPASQMDGIERYLADTLAPAVGTHHPSALPIPVNLPGQ
jgi:hypothetical protein